VVGLSPAGLFAVQLLHELGAATIVSVDADSAKRNLALAFGATDAMSLEVFTSSVVVDSMSTFNQVFFMSTGNDLLMSSIRAVNHLGIVVVAGSTTEKDFVLSDYYREIIIKESTIIGVNRPAREDWLAAVSMLGRSTMQLQEPSPAISGANAWHRRLNERADSGFVFAPIRTVLE
jgi:threonine dehydrogenase-like Zn-dependent dehydrogenase